MCNIRVIEEATDSNHASENWALILEVCDLINATEDGPKDAVRAIRKRLQQNAAKNYKTVLYTLTVSRSPNWINFYGFTDSLRCLIK